MSDVNTVLNPATEQVIAELPSADAAAAAAAVERAAVAQREWVRLSLSARRDALRAIAGAVESHAEEIFDPVAAVIPFDTEEEAVRLANDTIYGRSGSIWTSDVGRALRVARGIESGALSVNSNSSVRIQTPFGGFKQSGMGRALGLAAIDGYTELKNVFIRTEL